MSVKKRFFLSIAACAFTADLAWAIETSFNGDLSLFYGHRSIRGDNASDYLSINDSVGVFGLGAKVEIPSLVLDIKGRVVGAYGAGLAVDPVDPAYLDISPPLRFFNWRSAIASSDYSQSISDIEKAYFLFQKNSYEFSVGRRAVGIGTLKYLPIWNRFTPSVAHVGGPALVYNPDDIQLSYQKNKYAISAIHVQGRVPEDSLSTVLDTLYLKSIEIHFLGGHWWERGVGGLAFSKDIEGLTLRGEGLFFEPGANESGMQSQLGMGFEYAFNAKISMVMEGLYSSIGASNLNQYLQQPRDKFAILNANAYLFTMFEYVPFDFWNFSAGSLVNLMDTSWLGIAEVKYSWSDNLDISAQAKQPFGKVDAEFGAEFYPISPEAYFGYSSQYSMQMKYFF